MHGTADCQLFYRRSRLFEGRKQTQGNDLLLRRGFLQFGDLNTKASKSRSLLVSGHRRCCPLHFRRKGHLPMVVTVFNVRFIHFCPSHFFVLQMFYSKCHPTRKTRIYPRNIVRRKALKRSKERKEMKTIPDKWLCWRSAAHLFL